MAASAAWRYRDIHASFAEMGPRGSPLSFIASRRLRLVERVSRGDQLWKYHQLCTGRGRLAVRLEGAIALARLLEEGLEAGAIGVSTSRTERHRTSTGENLGTLRARSYVNTTSLAVIGVPS